MVSEKAISFGRYLESARLKKGISLAIISEQTNISRAILLSIEQEDFANLPASVFVKGFIRAFANAVDVDEDTAVRQYVGAVKYFKESAKMESDLLKPGSKLWFRLFGAIILMTGIITISIFLTAQYAKKMKSHNAVVQQKVKNITSQPAKIIQTKKSVDKIPEKQILKIIAIEETWMKVIIDDKAPNEYMFKPGDKMEIEASKGFNVLLGNASGIKLTINGKPVKIHGKTGQVVTIQLP